MTEQTILALSGPATAAAWFVASLLMKEKSREIAKEVLEEAIKAELAIFKGQFLGELNGTYRRSGECALEMRAVKEKLAAVDRHLEGVDRFSHDTDSHLEGSDRRSRESNRDLADRIGGLAMHIRETE